MRSKLEFMPHQDDGFTLVEILVALVILLIIITACIPLFTLATQITHTNRAKTIAAELAKQELEKTLAQVTPNNYNNEDPSAAGGAPLQTGVVGPYQILLGDGVTVDPQFSNFRIKKIVSWIDDPEDGLHPADTLPFDYKQLIIEVSCPSIFTGSVTRQADFKTFVAREGAASPVAGLIVNVVRGWRNDEGNAIPIEGALVSITGDSGSDSTMTNQFGQAMFPVSFPADGSVNSFSYSIEAEQAGLMMHPNPAHHNTVTVTRFSTNSIYIEMEEPSTLTLQFTPNHQGATVRLENSDLLSEHGGVLTTNLSPGDTRVSFSGLWPVGVSGAGGYPGAYALEVSDMITAKADLLEYAEDDWEKWMPDDELVSDDGTTEYIKNLWLYKADDYLWEANPNNYTSVQYHLGDHEHRLAYKAIDLSSFAPSQNIQCEVKLIPDSAGLALEKGSESSDFVVIFKSRDNALLDDSAGSWLPVMTVQQLEDLKNTGNGNISLDPQDLSDNFRLRFDSSPDIEKISFGNFIIKCNYEYSDVTFTGPGHNRSLRVNGN